MVCWKKPEKKSEKGRDHSLKTKRKGLPREAGKNRTSKSYGHHAYRFDDDRGCIEVVGRGRRKPHKENPTRQPAKRLGGETLQGIQKDHRQRKDKNRRS